MRERASAVKHGRNLPQSVFKRSRILKREGAMLKAEFARLPLNLIGVAPGNQRPQAALDCEPGYQVSRITVCAID
jgi:hypothetical protein